MNLQTNHIIFTVNVQNSLTLKPYGPTTSDLRAYKRSWLGPNPEEKLAEAVNIRQEFLQEENLKMPREEMVKNERYEIDIQEICEDEYSEIQETFGFNGKEKYLYNDEAIIHDKIKKFTELATEIQMNEIVE